MRRLAIIFAAVLAVFSAGTAAAGDISTRIVGPGRVDALASDWPFMTFVRPMSYTCGGSVVHSRWVLTAAHCVEGIPASGTSLHPGAYTRAALPAAQTPDASLTHPSYDPSTNAWDFALLRLPSITAAPATVLPAPSDDAAITAAQAAGSSAQVAGWGYTSCTNNPSDPPACLGPPTDTTSTILQTISGGIPLLTNAACAGFYPGMFLSATMICAGNSPTAAVRNDTCSGDSGGPMTATVNTRRVIVGVVSWGYRCGDPNRPGVYARVTAARTWICDTITSPAAISATASGTTASVSWTPDTTTCPWQNPTVQVTASPGGATATAPLSAGSVSIAGLTQGTGYTMSARVISSAGAEPPAATASVAIPTPAPAPAPAPQVAPCSRTFYQQAARTASNAAAPDGTGAVRVLTRLRIYEDAQSWCRTDLTFIFRDRRTGARLSQLPGSTLGYRRLTGRDFSAPVVSWPTAKEFKYAGSDSTGLGRRDARLVLVSYLKRTASMPSQANVELLVVRRIPADPAQPMTTANLLFAQKNSFGTAIGWATVS